MQEDHTAQRDDMKSREEGGPYPTRVPLSLLTTPCTCLLRFPDSILPVSVSVMHAGSAAQWSVQHHEALTGNIAWVERRREKALHIVVRFHRRSETPRRASTTSN